MTAHILASKDGLSARARGFLSAEASRVNLEYSDSEALIRDEYEEIFKRPADSFVELIRELRGMYGGLRYASSSWTFEEEITFFPEADLDLNDTGGMISLIEHSTAVPFGVWVAEDGGINFMYPTEGEAKYIRAFENAKGIIESDALYAECRDWVSVGVGKLHAAPGIAEVVSEFRLIDEVSGPLESWYESDGIRILIWNAYAIMLEAPKSARLGVWASDDESAARARRVFEKWLTSSDK